MKTTGQSARIVWGILLAVATSGAAHALTDEQQCIDRYNKRLRVVSEQQGKAVRRCILHAGHGSLTDAEAETCVATADDAGTVARKKQRVVELYPPFNLAKCTGAEPIQQGATVGNDAHVKGPADLVHDLFGTPLVAVSDRVSDERKCQDKAIQRATQLLAENTDAFWRCKTKGLRTGTVTNSTSLESVCMTPSIPDPSDRIAHRITRLVDQVTTKCQGLALSTLFQGLDSACHVSSATLANCVEVKTECRVCKTLNAADGMNRDCDLFDDGVANATCGPLPLHKCVLDTTPPTDSQLTLHIAALAAPLTLNLSGALDFGAGGAIASCAIQNISPINIPGIGFVCVNPTTGCSTGQRHCGAAPGPPLGIDVQSDGNIGACTSEAACDASCAAFCAPNAVLGAGCTAHCSGATEQACTVDADCLPANGSCNGPNFVGANANLCQCSCMNTAAHGPSDPGDLQCNLGTNLMIELTLPCDGVDPVVNPGSICIPFSTERATGLITDANFNPVGCPGGGPPCFCPAAPNVNDQSGAPIACSTLDTSTTTGMVAVGAANFFGTTIGDISVGMKTTCQ